MKINIKVLILFNLLSYSIFSQSSNNYDFIGTLILKNKALITYRIQFVINDSVIKGFSYTDINGKDETKSEISGFYNKKRKSIILKESKILYTKSKEIEDIFCFININGKIKLKDNKNSIRGSFIGLYKNKDTCSTGGKILLMSVKDAFNKFKKVAKKVSKLKIIDSITKGKFNTTRFLNEIKPNTLKSNEVLTVFWNSNKIILDVWDNGKEDGDLITIKFNNKTVLYKYEVKHKKKRLEFLLQEGKNIFNIIANNNGSIFPNTAKALLKDGKINYVISSNLEAGQTSKINIVYKKIKD